MKKIISILLILLLFCSLSGFDWQTRYYCYENGKPVTGTQKIDKVKYLFTKNGRMVGKILPITYINQWQGVRKKGKWTHTDFPYVRTSNGKLIKYTGCGITSCAMAITALRGKLTLPTKFNLIKYGFNGSGSNYNVTELTAKKYKLKGKVQNGMTVEKLKKLINKNRYVVVWVTDSIYGGGGNPVGGDIGHGGGHFVLIHGYWKNKFAVADPNNTSQTYVWSGKLQKFSSFNDHLGNGRKSYGAIWK